MPKKTPCNVLVAGFPRCASTYLAHLLAQHPDISVSSIKEVNFFNHTHKFLALPNFRHHRSKKSFDWYSSLFDLTKKIRMDFSILSSYDIDSPERIKKALGDVKIIFLTRDKDNHKKSMYNLMLQTGEIPKISYEKFLEKFKFYSSYYSDFDSHINRYKKHFSKTLAVNLVGGDTKKEVQKIIKFLNLKPHDFNYNVYRNSTKDRGAPKTLSKLRRNIFIHFPKTHTKIKKLTDKLR